jgi:hydrogenase maturation protease
MKTLVLGLGNPIVSDDGVGLRVADTLKPLLANCPDIDVCEDYWGGLRLMERLVGYDRAVIVDAICTGSPPGTIHHLAPGEIPTQRSASAHDVNLPTALELGRKAGMPLPPDSRVHLLGIEAADVINFSERCTPAVDAAIPQAVDKVMQILDAPLPAIPG